MNDNYVKGIYRAADGKLRAAFEFFQSRDEVGARLALSKLRFHLAAFDGAVEFSVWRKVGYKAFMFIPQIMGNYATAEETAR